ncbi:efflux transporter outer membrane subunit [Burkholderia stagnalis]|nr:efflux transporter outer membrane subunit [Burkholderia stagnalis]
MKGNASAFRSDLRHLLACGGHHAAVLAAFGTGDFPLSPGMKRRRLAAIVLATSGILSACATRTYERPPLDVPAKWAYSDGNTSHADARKRPSQWWTEFGDAQLDKLISSALSRNNNLATATLNVRQAQLELQLAGDPLQIGPQASVNARRERRLDNGDMSRIRSGALYGTVSFTVDLWGRLARQRDIAQWALQASEADRDTVQLNVVGTTADLYWRLAYLNQRLAFGEQSLATAMRTRKLVHAQYVAGAVSNLEQREAEQAVLTQRASLSQLQQNQVETRNALAVLFNAAPGSNVLEEVLGREPQALPASALPTLAEGLPAELLSRRPDLRAAELSLRQSLANIDVVRTSYYPTLSLTGSAGSASQSLANLLANPAAVLGAGLSLPFLNLKAMRLNTDLAQLQYETAVIGFRQTLYQAFVDVENALSARMRLAEQAELQAQALAAAREAERLYEIRYRAGAVALRMWLDAQESHRTAELLWAQARLSQLQNLVTLYQSIGGYTSIP